MFRKGARTYCQRRQLLVMTKQKRSESIICLRWHRRKIVKIKAIKDKRCDFVQVTLFQGSRSVRLDTRLGGLFNGGEEFIISIVCRETLPHCLNERDAAGLHRRKGGTLWSFSFMLFLFFSLSQGIFWLFDTDPRRSRNTTGPPYLFSALDETGNRSANSNPRWRIAADSDFFHTLFSLCLLFSNVRLFIQHWSRHPDVAEPRVIGFGLADDSFRILVRSS